MTAKQIAASLEETAVYPAGISASTAAYPANTAPRAREGAEEGEAGARRGGGGGEGVDICRAAVGVTWGGPRRAGGIYRKTARYLAVILANGRQL